MFSGSYNTFPDFISKTEMIDEGSSRTEQFFK